MPAAIDPCQRPFLSHSHSSAGSLPSSNHASPAANALARRFQMGGLIATLMLPQAVDAGSPPSEPAPGPSASPWTFASAVSAKTGYDDNVLLQDFGDQANRESWVNSLGAQLSATYQPNPLFKALISYAPDFTIYEGQSTENHATHRGMLNLSGKSGNTAWEWLNGVTRIDGDDLGPQFTLNGGATAAQIPAIGGVPIRDRRDAAIFKNSLKLTQSFGQMFLRPMVSFYHHNFMTEQHAPIGAFLGYENYIDRQEYAGGVDFGYEAWTKTWLVAGVRIGHQKQYDLLGASSPYDNDYYRVLFGIEGAPTDWLKLNVMAGPDFRDFNSVTPAGFDQDKVYTFIDATATITPTKVDTITLGVKRYLQPSYASISMYEDIVYEAGYKHQFDDRFAAGAGFKAYQAAWRPPAIRDEWIFTPSLSLSYTHNANLSAEFTYSYDWAESKISNTEGREFTRHLVWLGLKYAF